MKAALRPPSSVLLLLAMLGIFAWLFTWLRRRPTGGSAGQTTEQITGADGRTFAKVAAASADAPSRWRAVPDDGREYFPDLAWDAGQTTAPPIMRAFGA